MDETFGQSLRKKYLEDGEKGKRRPFEGQDGASKKDIREGRGQTWRSGKDRTPHRSETPKGRGGFVFQAETPSASLSVFGSGEQERHPVRGANFDRQSRTLVFPERISSTSLGPPGCFVRSRWTRAPGDIERIRLDELEKTDRQDGSQGGGKSRQQEIENLRENF